MLCPCESDAITSAQRLQSLIALETMLDDELDELERQYSLHELKLDWLQNTGHEDLCDIVAKNMDKTESLLRMYRPMLQDACAEKMELIRSIMESQTSPDPDPNENEDDEMIQGVVAEGSPFADNPMLELLGEDIGSEMRYT